MPAQNIKYEGFEFRVIQRVESLDKIGVDKSKVAGSGPDDVYYTAIGQYLIKINDLKGFLAIETKHKLSAELLSALRNYVNWLHYPEDDKI